MPSQNQKTLAKAVLTASLALAPVLPSRATTYDVKVRDCGVVVGEYDYLPYGGLASYCPPSDRSNDYLFGGKELESAHNVRWYDSGARYQSTHGIFTSQDPLAEKHYSISPYAYCAENPVNFTDYSGKEVIPFGTSELNMIRNTLPEDAREYVQLDKDGKIDKKLGNYIGVD